jgi:hypothetical protein
VRITGTITGEQLDMLGAQVERAVTERIAAAERELGLSLGRHGAIVARPAAGASLAGATAEGRAAERLDLASGTYHLASYDAGGALTPVAVMTAAAPDDVSADADAGAAPAAGPQGDGRESALRSLRDQVTSLGPDAVLSAMDDAIATDENLLRDSSGVTPEQESARQRLLVSHDLRQVIGAEIDRLRDRFPDDVRQLAYQYLDINKSFIYRERQSLGLGLPADLRSARQAAGLQALARAARMPEVALRLRDSLLGYPAGTVWAGLGYRMPIDFYPNTKPPLWFRPDPGPTWEQLQDYYDRLSALIAKHARELPEIYLLLESRSLKGFAKSDTDGQAARLDGALRRLDSQIEDARDKIRTGDIDWLDLTPLHQRLLAGQPSSSGIDWSLPYHQRVARSVIGDHQQGEFWKKLGLDALVLAAFIFAEIATGGAATFFLVVGVAGAGFQAVQALERAGGLETAHAAAASPDLELVTSRQVLAADEAALLATVFAVAAAVGTAERGLRALGGSLEEELGMPRRSSAAGPEDPPVTAPSQKPPVLKPSLLPQYSSKDSFMNAMRQQLLGRRLSGKPSLLDFLLDESGEWQKGTLITKSGRTIRGRYALSAPDSQLVQAGHMQSDVYAKAMGRREYLMLEDADTNWLTGQTAEARGAYLSKPAVMIDGFPVDIPTARLYEGHGLLPSGTVDAAPFIEAPDF